MKNTSCAQGPVDESAFEVSRMPVQSKKHVVWDRAAFEELLRLGEFAKALELVRHLRKLRPSKPSLAHALALLENHVEGQRDAHQASVLFEEACRAFLQGDKALAERMFLTCHQMQPDAWLVRFNLSRLKRAQSL